MKSNQARRLVAHLPAACASGCSTDGHVLRYGALARSFDLRSQLCRDLRDATGAGISVAVVDSGWDRRIADPRVLAGVGFVDHTGDHRSKLCNDDSDQVGHGTACTELILRVAPGVRVTPVRIFGQYLETSLRTTTSALRWAITQRFQIMNLSFGTFRSQGEVRELYEACESAREGRCIVVAAGREVGGQPSYPAAFDNVLSVGAGNIQTPPHFEFREREAVECIANGFHPHGLWLNGAKVPLRGDSYAAAFITGIIALLLERHPGAILEEVRLLLAQYSKMAD